MLFYICYIYIICLCMLFVMYVVYMFICLYVICFLILLYISLFTLFDFKFVTFLFSSSVQNCKILIIKKKYFHDSNFLCYMKIFSIWFSHAI